MSQQIGDRAVRRCDAWVPYGRPVPGGPIGPLQLGARVAGGVGVCPPPPPPVGTPLPDGLTLSPDAALPGQLVTPQVAVSLFNGRTWTGGLILAWDRHTSVPIAATGGKSISGIAFGVPALAPAYHTVDLYQGIVVDGVQEPGPLVASTYVLIDGLSPCVPSAVSESMGVAMNIRGEKATEPRGTG